MNYAVTSVCSYLYCNYFGYVVRSGIAGSYSSSIFSFLRNLREYFDGSLCSHSWKNPQLQWISVQPLLPFITPTNALSLIWSSNIQYYPLMHLMAHFVLGNTFADTNYRWNISSSKPVCHMQLEDIHGHSFTDQALVLFGHFWSQRKCIIAPYLYRIMVSSHILNVRYSQRFPISSA
jgi:hypothetical protein